MKPISVSHIRELIQQTTVNKENITRVAEIGTYGKIFNFYNNLSIKLHYWPTIMSVWFMTTLIITYGISVGKKHAYKFFPYISDTGTYPPESCIFGQLVNLGSLMMWFNLYLRYRQVEMLIQVQEIDCSKWNRISMWLAVIGCLGMSIVANFQKMNMRGIHFLGADMVLGGGVLYIIVQSKISLLLKEGVKKTDEYGISNRILLLRIIISVVSVILFCAILGFGIASEKDYEDTMSFLLLTLCITILLTVLWNISSIARYYLKFITFAVLSLIFATAPIPIMLLRPRNSKNALIPAYGLRKMSWLLGLNYKVEGKENIVKNNGSVVLINHQSCLDLIVLAEIWPVMDNCAVISKKEVFYLWPFGLASWLWGTIFIDRVNAGQAKNILNKTGKAIKDRKARILMFPEGTRSMKKNLLPFKKGAFHVALSSQCPIQPVVVDRYSFLNNYKFGEANITITILPAIETKDKSIEDLSKLMEDTYNTMSNCFQEKCAAQNKESENKLK